MTAFQLYSTYSEGMLMGIMLARTKDEAQACMPSRTVALLMSADVLRELTDRFKHEKAPRMLTAADQEHLLDLLCAPVQRFAAAG